MGLVMVQLANLLLSAIDMPRNERSCGRHKGHHWSSWGLGGGQLMPLCRWLTPTSCASRVRMTGGLGQDIKQYGVRSGVWMAV